MVRDIDVEFYDLVAKYAPYDVDHVPASSLLNDLGYDSLAIARLVVAIEAHYKIRLEPQDLVLANFETAESCLRLVERYINNA